MPDPLMRLLANLPAGEPSAVRAANTRQRCRARLTRQRPRATPPDRRMRGVLQPLIAALGATYLADVLVEAARLYGVWPE